SGNLPASASASRRSLSTGMAAIMSFFLCSHFSSGDESCDLRYGFDTGLLLDAARNIDAVGLYGGNRPPDGRGRQPAGEHHLRFSRERARFVPIHLRAAAADGPFIEKARRKGSRRDALRAQDRQ